MEAKDVRTLMEAYASVYEGYGKKKKGDCVSKSEKGDHNCAKKVCHEQYGEGETIFGQHAVPDENGFVSHYDVQFEHGIVENVSVEDMDILTMEAHGEHVEHEGESISETVVRTGPDGKPVFPHREGGPTEAEVRREMRAGKKPAPSTRGPKKPTSAPRADRKPAPSTRPSTRAEKQMKEESSIDEGIMGALKRVGKAVLGPADQSPEAEAARMGKRRGPAPNKQQPASMKEDADVFDLVKGHLMDEGLSEKEALEKMLTLTDEERTEMVEGSCMGGKDRKKKRK